MTDRDDGLDGVRGIRNAFLILSVVGFTVGLILTFA